MTPSVKLYSLSTCSHCKAARKFLEACGVQYDLQVVDLCPEEEQPALLEELRRFNPECTVPTIIIGNKIIVGFREQVVREALGL